ITSGAATVTLASTIKTARTPACWPPGSPVCVMDVAAPMVRTKFLGLTPDSAAPRPSDLPEPKVSSAAIQVGAGACSPGPGRLRHCRAASSRNKTPSTSSIAYAAVDGPLLLDTPAALAMTRTTAPTTTSPSTQPATNATPLLRARG